MAVTKCPYDMAVTKRPLTSYGRKASKQLAVEYHESDSQAGAAC